jgi:hypothetical protein
MTTSYQHIHHTLYDPDCLVRPRKLDIIARRLSCSPGVCCYHTPTLHSHTDLSNWSLHPIGGVALAHQPNACLLKVLVVVVDLTSRYTLRCDCCPPLVVSRYIEEALQSSPPLHHSNTPSLLPSTNVSSLNQSIESTSKQDNVHPTTTTTVTNPSTSPPPSLNPLLKNREAPKTKRFLI